MFHFTPIGSVLLQYPHVYDNAVSTNDIVIGMNFYRLLHSHENIDTMEDLCFVL